jgi:hypothetical protein
VHIAEGVGERWIETGSDKIAAFLPEKAKVLRTDGCWWLLRRIIVWHCVCGVWRKIKEAPYRIDSIAEAGELSSVHQELGRTRYCKYVSNMIWRNLGCGMNIYVSKINEFVPPVEKKVEGEQSTIDFMSRLQRRRAQYHSNE